MFWMHLAGYAVVLCILVSTTLGLLSWWNYGADEREVSKLRKELDLLDSDLFLREVNRKK